MRQEQPHDIKYFVTKQGSTYRYLPDGRSQRFKNVTDTLKKPMDLIVFLPPHDWIQNNSPKHLQGKFGENEREFERLLLQTIWEEKGMEERICNEKGNVMLTNQDLYRTDSHIFFFFVKDEKANLMFPVSKIPRIGFYSYDFRVERFGDQLGSERHIGNKVVHIKYKDGRLVE